MVYGLSFEVVEELCDLENLKFLVIMDFIKFEIEQCCVFFLVVEMEVFCRFLNMMDKFCFKVGDERVNEN